MENPNQENIKIICSVKNITENEATISIYGEIGENQSQTWSDESPDGTDNRAFPVVSKISEISNKVSTINVHLHGLGGSVHDGLAIYNALRNSKCKINTYNDGVTASMSSIIYLAGDNRFMSENGIFHLHQPEMMLFGTYNAKQLSTLVSQLEPHKQALINIISERTGLTPTEIETDYFDGEDHFLTGIEAKEKNFATQFTEPSKKEKKEKNKTPDKPKNYAEFIKQFSAKKQNSVLNFFNKLFSTQQLENQIVINYKQSTNMGQKMKVGNVKLIAEVTALIGDNVEIDEDQNFIIPSQNLKPIVDKATMFDALQAEKAELQNKLSTLEATHAAQLAEVKNQSDAQISNLTTEINGLKAKLAEKPATNPTNPAPENLTEDQKVKAEILKNPFYAKIYAEHGINK